MRINAVKAMEVSSGLCVGTRAALVGRMTTACTLVDRLLRRWAQALDVSCPARLLRN